ncbi:ring-cleaving dioxygenase [Haloarchaeobius amylolyticus]|uniref:ring-cleaving dioxygenase n=1 Tax=Haloarchaeobius amylolyticus TaxID=1198296 RepID=UPI002270AA50|nr:ring-cleaving dioxygenase [Haloarchaeobius amylolyticus]
MQTDGIHHVTAVASDPQRNVDFYTEVLGLRLVKRTVNFDDTSTYHLYYGDETGTPGTILTFFPFDGGQQGQPGKGQATATAFAIPEGAVDYWLDRFATLDVDHDEPLSRFDETVVPFRDHDGQPMELVATDTDDATDLEPWTESPVPAEYAIRGFHGVTLHSMDPDVTGSVLETLGYERAAESDDRVRYRVGGDRASVVDVFRGVGGRGVPGAGTVHHVAFRVPDDAAQEAIAADLDEIGLYVTEQKDRNYFRSIYFREPGGVLFEVATDDPGFTVDEPAETLGTELRLPAWLEDDREQLEASLPSLSAPEVTSE